jgi:hypothetical protein
MAGTEIDDAKPPHSDATAALHVIAFVVGPAVPDLVTHGTHRGQARFALAQVESGNATHDSGYLAITVALETCTTAFTGHALH